MRLTRRFVVGLLIAVLVVLSLSGVLEVRREVQLVEADMRRDAQVLAGIVAHAALAEWRREGVAGARALVEAAARTAAPLGLAWFEHPPTWLDVGDRVALAGGGAVSRRDAGAHVLRTAVHLGEPGQGESTLVVVESLDPVVAETRSSIRRTAVTMVSLLAACGAFVGAIGVVFVGRPTSKLVAKLRRAGDGDLTRPLVLGQRDELGEIANEVNAMCERLAAAHARALVESEERLRAVEQLRHADRLMTVGKLASGIAHELGTPLNVVGGRARMIADGEMIGDEARASADVIAGQAKRMTDIIRRLLDFARRKPAPRDAAELGPIATRAGELLRSMAHARHVTLAIDAPPTAPVLANAGELEQVLLNLIVNGLHATGAGGRVDVAVAEETATPPVEIGGGARPVVALTVTDTGRGMDDHTLEHAFEPFFTTKDVGEGTGLGLSIVYGIVRDHGGWIEVDSTVGKGTRFRVLLPTAPPTQGGAPAA